MDFCDYHWKGFEFELLTTTTPWFYDSFILNISFRSSISLSHLETDHHHQRTHRRLTNTLSPRKSFSAIIIQSIYWSFQRSSALYLKELVVLESVLYNENQYILDEKRRREGDLMIIRRNYFPKSNWDWN